MKKKSGVNIVFFVFIAFLFSIFSCSRSSKIQPAGQLIKADLDFSAFSEREGMHRAFLEFAADSAVLLRDRAYPSLGKESLAELFAESSDTSFVLTWEPVFEKIAESGDLGYTYGFYTSTSKSTGEESRGTYLTIWQKEGDGKWKFILDTGNQGLPE